MKGEDPEEWFWEPDGIQTELFPPEPPKSKPLTEEQIARAPHLNMLEKYYGKDWEVKPVEGLGDHF